ncbi:AMP-dependent synthetase [Acrocarpospora pleiomorpha]|uniref:AMP-dependent synthetase n=1 Tax=Acrocarpospora pleiomorpha TaxID=90975 RepID=A0A5M3XJ91_9ACTN|nr:AMP-binding protein [Acrocarpospora pleiomorpha]GES20842.1 AMP-dependent synthetase [Acrocarpospora pleiomorpha]
MTRVDQTLAQWLTLYRAEDADVAGLLCDNHNPAAVAFTFVAPDLTATALTYGELADRSRRLANGLAALGVGRGDRVPVLMGKRPELIVTLLAIWRLGAVHVPLFTAFATGAVRMRVEGSGAKLVVTEPSQRAKLDPIAGITVLETGAEFDALLTGEPIAKSVRVGGDGTFIQLYTSGTTGSPKGVPVPVWALAAFRCYLHYGLDVQPDDVFWNAADPGWAYGLYYAVIAPLAAGRTSLLFEAGFAPETTAEVVRQFSVTNFAGAPTMYRAMIHAGVSGLTLRRASAAGEPLTLDVVAWGRTALSTPVRDHYGQTELGMVIGNHWHPDVIEEIKDGSMGRPLPGFTARIAEGQIAIDTKSPLLWFTRYDQAPDKTAERFSPDGHLYLTADTGRVDEEGYYFFTARDDDVILAAGYRIGPFDVESVLATHPAVAEVAVVGRPDPQGIRGEVVEAFVVAPGGGNDELARELQELVRDTYSKHAYPRAVHFVDALPKTPSGKIQRYLLRQR